ncbi:hypothetical protein F4775DRAFT_602628 [Biscogniauxia sp. FL1348]|nr:hypothetical protein F4775DRAFT_602628 [Biscogniauxia sp. FL1348]
MNGNTDSNAPMPHDFVDIPGLSHVETSQFPGGLMLPSYFSATSSYRNPVAGFHMDTDNQEPYPISIKPYGGVVCRTLVPRSPHPPIWLDVIFVELAPKDLLVDWFLSYGGFSVAIEHYGDLMNIEGLTISFLAERDHSLANDGSSLMPIGAREPLDSKTTQAFFLGRAFDSTGWLYLDDVPYFRCDDGVVTPVCPEKPSDKAVARFLKRISTKLEHLELEIMTELDRCTNEKEKKNQVNDWTMLALCSLLLMLHFRRRLQWYRQLKSSPVQTVPVQKGYQRLVDDLTKRYFYFRNEDTKTRYGRTRHCYSKLDNSIDYLVLHEESKDGIDAVYRELAKRGPRAA